MNMWMKDKNFKLEECKTLEELLVAIATNIKNDYVNFMAYISREGVVRFYENSAPFTRRMMFFEYVGGPIKLRKMVRDWVLCQVGCWYNRNSVEVLCDKEIKNSEILKRAEELKKYSGDYHRPVEYMMDEITAIMEKNPILNDDRVDYGLRISLMRNALKNSTAYARYEKEFESAIKRIIAAMINEVMDITTWTNNNCHLRDLMKGI